MAIEIPSPTMLRQLQAGFRRLAGVSSFDPDDPSLPPLPSLADAIEILHPDLHSSLRCPQCGAGLVRGEKSTLCIFCGADRSSDGAEQCINFNSSVGCRKLMDYLGLDGSEIVTLQGDLTTAGKSPGTPHDGLSLSDLLDMEVRWPSNVIETFDSIKPNETSPNTYSLNLKGYDIDTFLSERMREITSSAPSESNEQSVTRKQNTTTRTYSVSHSEDFSAFENLRNGDEKTSSSNIESSLNIENLQSGNSVDDWEAEFQSANSGIVADSEAPEQVVDSSFKEVVHDPVTENTFDQSLNNHETSSKNNVHGSAGESGESFSSSNWIQDDHWPVTTAILKTVDQPKHESSVSDAHSSLNNTSSSADNWLQDNLWPTATSKHSESSANIDKNDDFFDSWKDFTSSSKTQEDVLNPANGDTMVKHSVEPEATDLWSTTHSKELDNTPVVGEDDAFDDWQDFTSSMERQNPPSEYGGESKTTSNVHSLEAKLDDSWLITEKVGPDTSKNINDGNDFLGDWPDFMSSSAVPAGFVNHNAKTESTGLKPSSEERTDLWNSDGTKELHINNTMDAIDESFDDWQDFTGSSVVQEKSTTSKDHSNITLFDSEAQAGFVDRNVQTEFTRLEPSSEERKTDLWTSDSTKELNKNNSMNAIDESFDVWQNFTVSNTVQEKSKEHSNITLFDSEAPPGFDSRDALADSTKLDPLSGKRITDLWTSDDTKKMHKNNSMDAIDESFADWNDFTGSSMAKEKLTTSNVHSSTTLSEPSLEKKSVDLWQVSEETEPVNSQDDLFDDWRDFAISSQAHGSLSSSGSGLKPDALSIENPVETKSRHEDDWQDFTSSSVHQNVPSSGVPPDALSTKNPLETNSTVEDDWQYFTSTNQADRNLLVSGGQPDALQNEYPAEIKSTLEVDWQDFTSSSQAHPNIPSSGVQPNSFSIEDAIETKPTPDVSSPNRMKAIETTGMSSNSMTWNMVEVPNATAITADYTKSKVDKLISQIPDLSFMLADELSIPEKPDS